ncbi:MAG: hypothetical protein COW02_03540 [Comamonadaceae bacterium CG12_big_fil_rev_8_21_14_0_65_59_15]|nr:MAG: hypothetical protein COW02_03540 [Comamonadaceae bacterium CG12_big_fil_rev_8_21_14_0_65_59_15]
MRKVVEKQFEFMSRNLFFISAYGRFLLGNSKEDEIVKAEEIAAETILKAIQDMQKRIGQVQSMIETSGNDAEVTFFNKQHVMELPITTPGAAQFAQMMVLTDQFYTLNYELWLAGEIDSRAKFKNESDARKVVLGAIGGIARQFNYILNLTRAKDSNEADKASDGLDEDALIADAEDTVNKEIGNDSMVSSVAAHSKPAKKAVEANEVVAQAA